MDRQFLKTFQAEKNETLQEVRKEAYRLLQAAEAGHKGESLEAVNEFFQLYLAKNKGKDAEQQADVDSILEQTEALLAAGHSAQDIARIIKLDRTREAQRLARAQAQKKLEALIHKEKALEQTIIPLIEGMKHAALMEERLTLAAFGMMLLINSLGDRFAKVAPRIIAQLSVKMLDDPELIAAFHAIHVETLVQDLTQFFIQDFRQLAARGRSTPLPEALHASLERIAQHLETWLRERAAAVA